MIVCVSGGFDPLHIGHLRLFRSAADLGDLTVILNSDDWLARKKGFCFQSWPERREVIQNIRCVTNCVEVNDADGTVLEALDRIKPDVFVKSGDRVLGNIPEEGFCRANGIEIAYVGKTEVGGKLASSSETVKRGWGYYEVLDDTTDHRIKRLTVMPRSTLTRQYHLNRREHWHVITGHGTADLWYPPTIATDEASEVVILSPGVSIEIPTGVHHRIRTDGEVLRLVEVQVGHCDEDDIVRVA